MDPASSATRLMEKAKEQYRLRMESFVASNTANPPTRFELNQKHQDLVAELKASTPGVNSLQLESDLREMYNSFVSNNKVHRQMSLLKSALGNSLFEETQKDLQKLAQMGSLGSMGSVDVSE